MASYDYTLSTMAQPVYLDALQVDIAVGLPSINYISSWEDTDTVTVYFPSALSAPEKTQLDNYITDYLPPV